MLRQLLLSAHLAGMIVWVGGMFFAYFCLRPAAAAQLDPPKRLPLWSATFARFLPLAAAAVVLVLGSGLGMMLQTGFANAPLGWHLMFALGLLMAGVFVFVQLRLYPQLKRHSEQANWPAAGAALNSMRHLVAVNLVLSVLTIAAAVSAR